MGLFDRFKKKKEEPKPASKPKKVSPKDSKEPWVDVLEVKLDKDNPSNGYFELDWNNEFVEKLMDAGYTGETAEAVVDGWFKTIARQILDDEGLDTNRNAGYINTSKIDKDKSEVK